MLRMRTIDQMSAYIRDADPDTALTKTALRRLVISGEIPSKKIGSKFLVSIEAVSEYLTSTAPVPKEHLQSGKIRPVLAQPTTCSQFSD